MDTGCPGEQSVDFKHSVLLQNVHRYSDMESGGSDPQPVHYSFSMAATTSTSGVQELTPLQIKLERQDSGDEYASASGVEMTEAETNQPVYPVKMARAEESSIREFCGTSINDINSSSMPTLRNLLNSTQVTSNFSASDSESLNYVDPSERRDQMVTAGLTLPVKIPPTKKEIESSNGDQPQSVESQTQPTLVKIAAPVNIATHLKQGIDKSCLQLAQEGEESLFLSVNINKKLCSFVGSEAGRNFLTKRPDVMEHFFQFCQVLYKARSSANDTSDQQNSTAFSMDESELSSPTKPPPKQSPTTVNKPATPPMKVTQTRNTTNIQPNNVKPRGRRRKSNVTTPEPKNETDNRTSTKTSTASTTKIKPYGLRQSVKRNFNLADFETQEFSDSAEDADWIEEEENRTEDEEKEDKVNHTPKRRKATKPKVVSSGAMTRSKSKGNNSADIETLEASSTKLFQDFLEDERFTTTTNRQGHFECRKCDLQFKWSNSYRLHMHRHSELLKDFKMIKCDDCNKEFLAERDLQSHLRHVHKKLRCFHCKECNNAFHTVNKYNRHLVTCRSKSTNQDDDEIQIKQEILSDEEEQRFQVTEEDILTCNICLRVFKTLDGLERHMTLHSQPEIHTCKFCKLDFESRSTLNKHLKTHEDEGGFKCPTCDKKFLLPWTLYRHNTEVHGKKQVMCKRCGKFFNTQAELKEHFEEHNEVTMDVSKYSCHECGKYFDLPRYLYVHYKEVHKTKKSICRFCGLVLDNRVLLSSHLVNHNAGQPNSCKFCAKGHASAEELQKHMDVHFKNDSYFKCDICGEVFRKKSNLSDHMINHTNNYPFKCKECGKGFKRRGKLKIHMISHREARPFQCEECGMCFKMQSTLTCHIKRHEGKLTHACTYCEKKFKSVEGVRNHMLLYHIKPEDLNKVPFKVYTCDFCGKMMGQKHVYMRHVRMHTGERPCTCDVCGKHFTMPAALNVHKKTHMERKPYHCEICDYGFVDQSKFKKHIQTIRHREAKELAKSKKEKAGSRLLQKETNNVQNIVHSQSNGDGGNVEFENVNGATLSMTNVEVQNNQSTLMSMEDNRKALKSGDSNVTYVVVPNTFPEKYNVLKSEGLDMADINKSEDSNHGNITHGEEEVDQKCVILGQNDVQANQRTIIIQNNEQSPGTLLMQPTSLIQNKPAMIPADSSTIFITIPEGTSPGVITQVLQSANLENNSNSIVIAANSQDDGVMSDSTLEAVQSLL